MILNFYFFRVEITVIRSRWTRREIREEVHRIAKTGDKIAAIKRYRELVKPMPTLAESKAFVDSLPG